MNKAGYQEIPPINPEDPPLIVPSLPRSEDKKPLFFSPNKPKDSPIAELFPRVWAFGLEDFGAKYEHLEDLPQEVTNLFDTAYSAAVAIGKEFSDKKQDPLVSIADPQGDIQSRKVLRKDKDMNSVTVYDNSGLGISIADKDRAVSLNPGMHIQDNGGDKHVAFQASLYDYSHKADVYKPGADIGEQVRFEVAPKVAVAFLMTAPTENKPEQIEVVVRRHFENGDFNTDDQEMSETDLKAISELTDSLASLTERYTTHELKPETSPFFTREAIDSYWNSQD